MHTYKVQVAYALTMCPGSGQWTSTEVPLGQQCGQGFQTVQDFVVPKSSVQEFGMIPAFSVFREEACRDASATK